MNQTSEAPDLLCAALLKVRARVAGLLPAFWGDAGTGGLAALGGTGGPGTFGTAARGEPGAPLYLLGALAA